jgi:hypothetical protein
MTQSLFRSFESRIYGFEILPTLEKRKRFTFCLLPLHGMHRKLLHCTKTAYKVYQSRVACLDTVVTDEPVKSYLLRRQKERRLNREAYFFNVSKPEVAQYECLLLHSSFAPAVVVHCLRMPTGLPMHEQAIIIMPLPMSTIIQATGEHQWILAKSAFRSMETFTSQIDSVRQV